FAVMSTLLALFFGVALGNVVRGVPIDPNGWFSLALFTDFRARPPVGILDGYTVAVGAFAIAALLAHGAAFLVLPTHGALAHRRRRGRATVLVAVRSPVVSARAAPRDRLPGDRDPLPPRRHDAG